MGRAETVCVMSRQQQTRRRLPWPASWAGHFRVQANTCRALARGATEHWVATSLTELAEDLLHRADRIEVVASRSPRSR
jgi:hypothetical protein